MCWCCLSPDAEKAALGRQEFNRKDPLPSRSVLTEHLLVGKPYLGITSRLPVIHP